MIESPKKLRGHNSGLRWHNTELFIIIENAVVATGWLTFCNRLVIDKTISAWVHMACDSLSTKSLLQVVSRLVAR